MLIPSERSSNEHENAEHRLMSRVQNRNKSPLKNLVSRQKRTSPTHFGNQYCPADYAPMLAAIRFSGSNQILVTVFIPTGSSAERDYGLFPTIWVRLYTLFTNF